MRSFVVMAMFVASLAEAGWKDYEEVRDLTLDAAGVETLNIRAGAGSMDVSGVDDSDAIAVKATIVVPNADADDAANVIEREMVLELDREGDSARLNAWFEERFMGLGSDAYIALQVGVPTGTAINIDDGSGSIDVMRVGADVSIDDGSGSIDIEHAANVKIDDGSGSIDVVNAAGDVSIVDGSGSITVRGVGGSVTVDDGSGSISVSDVEKDFIVTDDGSGSVNWNDVRGRVDVET